MLGAGVADRSGLFDALLRASLSAVPKRALVPAVMMTGMLTCHAFDAGCGERRIQGPGSHKGLPSTSGILEYRLSSLFDEASKWRDWSDAMLTQCAARGPLIINSIVFAEVCAGFDSIDAVEAALPEVYLRREPLPWAAAFLAGRAFVQYRRRGGTTSAPLPDFYIGAHAAVAGHTLLTRDTRRYLYYFPTLRVIAP